MTRLNSPSFTSYRPAIDALLSTQGPSLFTLRSDPPENIYPLSTDRPIDLSTGMRSEEVIVRQPSLDHNANIRGVAYLILHRCFFSPGMRPFSELLDLILSQNFKIQFPQLGYPTNPQLFNDEQFKKLFLQFLRLIDSNECTIEDAINKYPILDVILIHIIRTVANQHYPYEYTDKIPTDSLLKFVHQAFGLRVIDQQGDEYYKFENNYELIDGKKVYIIIPRQFLDNSRMKVSKVNSDHTFINVIGDIKDSMFIQQSHVFPVLRGNEKDTGPVETNNLTRLFGPDYGKVTSSQVFTSRLQKSVHHPSQSLTSRVPFQRQPVHRSTMFEEKTGFRPSSYSVSKHNLNGDVKDELRKSQMRVSVMKNKQDIKNRRVSTAQIFNNDDYFGTKSQYMTLHEQKKPAFTSTFSPFEQIMKQNHASQKTTTYSNHTNNTYTNPFSNNTHTSTYNTINQLAQQPPPSFQYQTTNFNQPFQSMNLPNTINTQYTRSSSITSNNYNGSRISSNPVPQVTSSYNISADGKTNIIKVEINQPMSTGGSLEAYYSDFTGSHVLDFLPSHNRSNIQGIKNSLTIDKKY